MYNFNENYPPPFPKEEPAFVELLKKRKKNHIFWDTKKNADIDEVSLLPGMLFSNNFPDSEGLLESVVEDFLLFIKTLPLPYQQGVTVVTCHDSAFKGEDFVIEVKDNGIFLKSGTTEGIRRAIYRFKNLVSGLEKPALKKGTQKYSSWLKNRISRCFFSPIKRPPFFRDELLDDIDYYPDEYLNRLAEEGVNGIWLTISFKEICKTSISSPAHNSEKRLQKLRKTINQCSRYGIKVWAFCTEPAAWSLDNPVPEGYSELIGPEAYGKWKSFCPASKVAEQYLYEVTNYLFSAVPGLGGLITISHGERITSCLSCVSLYSDGKVPCNKKCSLTAREIISKVLTPMRNGIRDAAPEAEMISWLYMPHSDQPAEWIYEMAEGIPEDVILAYNFESGCNRRQAGKIRTGGDYWLSCTGPSDRFGRMAQMAQKNKYQMAAKIQVGCSHEVATVPFVPVPGILYQKYKAMKKLGVNHVMQCWFFGNYPGIMNRAAGQLSYENFSDSEDNFLKRLAEPEWGKYAWEIASIWQKLANAYQNYPLDIQFQYYGPMHDGLVWPLHFDLKRQKLPRSWKPDEAPAGDAIGECLVHHTLNELVLLTGKLSKEWSRAVEESLKFRDYFRNNFERSLDFILMDALNLQFRSAYNILRFYSLRNKLFYALPCNSKKLLASLKDIIKEEIRNSHKMIELCHNDKRLGYHSEAEVYKYFPEKLQWRIKCLENLLHANKEAKVNFGSQEQAKVYCCSKWYSSNELSFCVKSDDENLNFHIKYSGKKELNRETIRLFFMDAGMVKTPWWELCIRRDQATPEDEFTRQTTPRFQRYNEHETIAEDILIAAKVDQMETSEGWQLRVRIPLAALDFEDEVLFGIQHDWCDDKLKLHFSNIPEGRYQHEDRLFLGYYAPEKLARLKIGYK